MRFNFTPMKNKKLIWLSLFFSFLILISLNTTSKIYASIISPNGAKSYNLFDFKGQKLNYTFEIADKLSGDGAIQLTFSDNKIQGTATGLGKVSSGRIDLNTSIDGKINKLNGSLDVTIDGVGKPRIVPGSVTFKGPLQGGINIANGTIQLRGNVNINGRLASLAGFEDEEQVLIEIQIASVIKELRKLAYL